MATKDDIPTDLALEIGDNLAPNKFIAALRAFFGLTEEIAQLPSQEGSPSWRVTVSKGSNIIALDSAQFFDKTIVNAALQRMYEGTEALASGELSAVSLSEKAVEYAKRLSDLTIDNDHVIPMRIWVSRRPIEYGPQVAELVRESRAESYDDFGTLEGTLRVISDQNGSIEIRIVDPLWYRPIPCRMKENQVDQAIEAFRKRVEVSGMIHYNSAGRPTSIRMEALTVLPDDDTLPTVADVVGIFLDG